MAHLAETTHILRVKNRSGNVHDGKAGLPFLRDLWAQLAPLRTGRRLRGYATPAEARAFRQSYYGKSVRAEDRRAPLAWSAIPLDYDVRHPNRTARPEPEPGAVR